MWSFGCPDVLKGAEDAASSSSKLAPLWERERQAGKQDSTARQHYCLQDCPSVWFAFEALSLNQTDTKRVGEREWEGRLMEKSLRKMEDVGALSSLPSFSYRNT